MISNFKSKSKLLFSIPHYSFSTPQNQSPLEITNGLKFFGTTPESSKTLLHLLDQNNEKLDIFYRPDKLYHSHLVHHLLASYSLGASPSSLNNIYNNYSSYLHPKEKSNTYITHKNWMEHLGNKDLYTDYLRFFQDMINYNTMQQCFDVYAMHPQIFRRLFSGAFHPLIHAGYGVEFNLPMILAEGLADAAVHPDYLADLLDDKYINSNKKGTKKILDIIDEIQRDPTFDGLAGPDDPFHVASMKLASKIDTIKEYANSWAMPKNRVSLEKGLQELYHASVLLYGATAIRPDKESIRLDFFILHGLTSMLFVQIMQPFMVHERRIRIVRAHFATLLAIYVARGRPKLNKEALYEYKPKDFEVGPNPWLDVIKEALLEEHESHFIKAIRALMRGEQLWGADQNNTYLKVAMLTVEGYKKYKFAEDGGIGWDETWNVSPIDK